MGGMPVGEGRRGQIQLEYSYRTKNEIYGACITFVNVGLSLRIALREKAPRRVLLPTLFTSNPKRTAIFDRHHIATDGQSLAGPCLPLG